MKSNLQYFQEDWNKTVNWANQNKIPKSSWYPVYQLDLQRYANGEFPMSQAERARAILSASNLQANTVLPTDNPSPTNVFQNTKRDLQNIFTGLMPTHLIGNIFDEVKNTFEHPQWLADPTKNTLMQWLPGWADLGEYKRGGIADVLSHPLVSFLDVLPISDSLLRLSAKTPIGEAVAGKLGLTGEQMSTRVSQGGYGSTIRLAGRAVSRLPGGRLVPGFRGGMTGLPMPAELRSALVEMKGREGKILKPLTVGQRWKAFARSKGLSKDQADLMAGALTENLEQTRIHINLAKPFYDSVSKLSLAEQRQLHDIIQKSGRQYSDLLNDDSLSVNMRQAIRGYRDIEGWFNDMILSSDRFAKIRLPDGTDGYYENTPGQPVLSAKRRADDALARANRAAEASDELAAEIERLDTEAAPYLQRLRDMRQTLYSSVRSYGADTSQLSTLDPWAVGRLFHGPGVIADGFQVKSLQGILGDGGLLDLSEQALQSGDFRAFRTVIHELNRRFRNVSFSQVGPELAELRQLSGLLEAYSRHRVNLGTKYTAAFDKRTVVLQREATKAVTAFEKAVIQHPPSNWRPVYLDAFVRNLLRHENGKAILGKAAQILLKEKGVAEQEVKAIRENPRLLYEIIANYSLASHTDIMSQVMDKTSYEEVKQSALKEVAQMRAEGFVPHYIPNVRSTDVGELGSYNVFISTTRHPTVDAAFERLFDFTSSVYDIMAGTMRGMKQILARDGTLSFMDNHVQQFLYPVKDLMDLYMREYHPSETAFLGSYRDHFEHVLQNEWNLKLFDPQALFGLQSARLANNAYYIPTDIANSLEKVLDPSNQALDKSVFGRGTTVFRTAVLGYSPRFIAHIVFGGTFLVALRVSPHAFRYIGDAYKMAKEGTSEVLRRSTQVGADPVELQIASAFRKGGQAAVDGADKNFHYWAGMKMRNLILHEMMDKLNLDPSQISSWFKVLPAFTFKFTNFATNMQRSIVYLDGAAKAERQGWILDENGNRITITPDRAHEEGMKAAERVMGDLRHMTPLERHTFTKIMPFYGWTKHIIRYVSLYPMDHPYRAMFLSNLANMNSEDVPSALPTRIQLLFFLGSPNVDGSVTGIDVRALDPLRDTANYASLTGWLSSLNPALTAPVAMVDPSFVFGDNVLYPQLEYNQLYGTKVAGASGNALTAAEQFIPQLTSLDIALGISSQYKNLRRTDPTAYARDIFTSLGLPFMPETVNLRQIAGRNEIDRYQQAAQAAQNAWQSGDFSGLAGYPTVPDPRQTGYNITPMALEEEYKKILAATGQPPAEVAPELPAPAL
jgi:hypothetical protein